MRSEGGSRGGGDGGDGVDGGGRGHFTKSVMVLIKGMNSLFWRDLNAESTRFQPVRNISYDLTYLMTRRNIS
jgi:hypothetical protein